MADPATPSATAAPRGAHDLPSTPLLDALFANARVGLAFWDRELRYRRINRLLASMNGVPVEAHIGRRLSEVLPELGPRLEATFQEVIDSGEAVRDVDIVGETPAAPGVTRHWLANYFPVRGDDGTVAGVAGLIFEVTGERRANLRADEAMQRSAFVDAELSALYAALPVGVAFLNTDLRYERVNETLARLNGRPVSEHVGASLEDIVGDAARHLREALKQVLDTREPIDMEVTLPLPHDPADVRTLEVTYFPVLDESGGLLGVGGAVHDVTTRQELEVEQSRLLREALLARAQAEAAKVRADDAREEAEHARAEAERGRERIEFLARAGREMAASMEWEATLRSVVRSAVPVIADWCWLTIAESDGRLRVAGLAHQDPDRERLGWTLAERHPPSPDDTSGAPNVIRTGEVELVVDLAPGALPAAGRDEEHVRLLESLNLRHVVVAPLTTATGIVGALSFGLGDSDRRFSDDDVTLITSLASRAALHVQNARLYTERSHIAKTLQASLRPPALPAIPGAELAGRYRPAGDQNEVGGDFYDVFATADSVWTAIIGDVSGKGPEAATVTALARHTLRTASLLHDDPAANLALLNRALHADSPHFCTVFYARVCPGDVGIDLRFSNGGHPAPLLVRPDGTVHEVDDARGPLVGGFADATFHEATLRLDPGELLLIYTDGVTEVRTSDVEFGERELRRILAERAGAPADEVVAAVEQRVVELQHGAPRDDIALVAIKAVAS